MFHKSVRQAISKIDSRKLRNNTQRVLLALIKADGNWVSRKSLRVPSATSRLRDLRKAEYGRFKIVCNVTAETNPLPGRRGTFYRLDPESVTLNRVLKVFEGVV